MNHSQQTNCFNNLTTSQDCLESPNLNSTMHPFLTSSSKTIVNINNVDGCNIGHNSNDRGNIAIGNAVSGYPTHTMSRKRNIAIEKKNECKFVSQMVSNVALTSSTSSTSSVVNHGIFGNCLNGDIFTPPKKRMKVTGKSIVCEYILKHQTCITILRLLCFIF